jgi:hypothetical protein
MGKITSLLLSSAVQRRGTEALRSIIAAGQQLAATTIYRHQFEAGACDQATTRYSEAQRTTPWRGDLGLEKGDEERRGL